MTDMIKDALSCPICGGGSAVYRRDGATGYRYRRCQDCAHAFVTQEVILSDYTVARYTRRKTAFAPAPAQADHPARPQKASGHPVPARMAQKTAALRPRFPHA
ncbi:hypothetical protein [Novispirillum itersonii]|uniref:hypothetical protein n=1 Tax=Novispirillum itersonii TaxID=189 RepID=UPI0012DCB451|nr:hypothetical protein [Novispirillum itersonii]